MSWEEARQKIQKGREYRDTVDVPFGDPVTGEVVTIELTHRLLDEEEYWNVAQSIDTEALDDDDDGDGDGDGDDGVDEEVREAQERARELQQKDELSDAEERELEQCLQTVHEQQGALLDILGEETFDALLNVGQTTLTPSSNDIQNAFDLTPDEQEDRFGFVPSTKEQMRDALELEMEEEVTDQPYPIKLMVGMKAWAESQSVLGDTDIDASNPN